MAGGEADFVNDRAPALSVVAIFAVVAVGHLSLFPGIADLDGFYHIGHALAYLEGSLLDTSLPWATRSVINDVGGDLWWGFHVLLLPFAALGRVGPAVQLAAVGLTLLLVLTFWTVLRRLGVSNAGWWTALFLVAVPNISFRFLMVRPHVVSLAASLALLSALVRGRWWHVALLSALMSWVHLNLFWMAPCLAIAYAMTRVPLTVFLGREQPDTGVPIRFAIPAAVVGTLIGWLLRPDPLATAELLNVQLVMLFTQKAIDAPLTFASELSPIGLAEVARTSWLFGVSWLVMIAVVATQAARGRLTALGQANATFLVTSILVSAVFLALALLSARRAMEQWVAFGFIAFPFAAWLVREELQLSRFRRPLTALAIIALAAHLAWGSVRHSLNVELIAFPSSTLRDASAFLADTSEPGDIVFHARWDNFGPLFAHNRTNRYLGGMDPIFQFAHDPQAYWEFFYMSVDVNVEWTCDAYPCMDGVATDSHEVLRDHFGARWVLVEPTRNPKLSLHMLNDPRFELAFESQRAAVFEVVSVDEPGRP